MPRANLMNAFRRQNEEILWLNEALHAVDIRDRFSVPRLYNVDTSFRALSFTALSIPTLTVQRHISDNDLFITPVYLTVILLTWRIG